MAARLPPARRARLVSWIAAAIVPSAVAVADVQPESGGSPRAALSEYLELCRGGRFQEASRFLDLRSAREPDGVALARQLKAVLDRHVWFDLDAVSPLPEGERADGLPQGVDEIGTVTGSNGEQERVRLVRQPQGHWAFSQGVVGRTERWYEALPDRRLREVLPERLFRPGPRELLWWQWIALPVILVLSWIAGRLLGWLTKSGLGRIAARTTGAADDRMIAAMAAPITAAWAIGLLWAATPSLGLYQPAQEFVHDVLGSALLVTLFWAASRAIDAAAGSLSALFSSSPLAAGIVPLGVRAAKISVAAVALVTLLSALGYPVASLLAGLGLGGLALALAAQKTVENLFGSISIALDQPLKTGDFVRVDDLLGTVEAIGLRSTRIRTLDRTLVTLPNGRLSDMRLESFSARDRMRLACTVALEYGTTADQMREVLSGLERVLRSHSRIWPDAVVVRFRDLASSSLDVEVMAWFQTRDWSEFQLFRQEILIEFMDVVERAGASFAFPTRTVHLVSSMPGRLEATAREARAPAE